MGWSDGSASNPPEEIKSTPQKHHEFFTLKNNDGEPVVGQKYRMTTDDGSTIVGFTNDQGQTEHLWTHES